MKDDNLPPNNETVEDGGGCYVAGSREQDAAHSFEETLQDVELKGNFYAMEYAPFMMKVFEKFSLYTPHETTATGSTELTRLRSELQQAKQEIANHIAVNSLLVDSDGKADLANKLYKATSELQQRWTKIDGINYPLNTLLIVWNGSYNFAHFNTSYNKWIALGQETSDTRNLMQFPPTHFMEIPEQPKL